MGLCAFDEWRTLLQQNSRYYDVQISYHVSRASVSQSSNLQLLGPGSGRPAGSLMPLDCDSRLLIYSMEIGLGIRNRVNTISDGLT